MGILYYDTHEFEFDDLVLAHLKVVITHKLRRREAFFLNWRRAVNLGSGRMSVWITPDVPVSFSATDVAHRDLRQDWIEEMTDAANSANGVDVLGMPKDPPHRGSQRRERL